MSANAVTSSLFGTDLRTFLFDRWTGDQAWSSTSDNSFELTLSELLNFGKITNMGMSSDYTLGSAMTEAFKRNWMKAVGSVLIAQFANNAAKKMGVYRMLNRTIRTVGAGKMLKF